MNSVKVLVAPPKGSIERQTYLNWLTKNGFEPFPMENNDIEIEYPLILCGGPDIGTNTTRDANEMRWIASALKNNQPIIGICKGMQILNHYFGGTVSNIPEELKENHLIDSFEDDNDHSARVSQYHLVSDIYGNITEVNSRHHQYCETIPDNFKATHMSFDIGYIIEGFEDINNRIWAVQWHPERNESMDNIYPLDKL